MRRRAMGRPRKPQRERVLDELSETARIQKADLERLIARHRPEEEIHEFRAALERTKTAIRNVYKNGLPAGYVEKWGERR